MTEPKKPFDDQKPDTEFSKEIEVEVPAGTEVEVETEGAPKETKGAKQHNGKEHANQFTQGRNDDRGRKE